MNSLGAETDEEAGVSLYQGWFPGVASFGEKGPSEIQPHDREGRSRSNAISRQLTH